MPAALLMKPYLFLFFIVCADVTESVRVHATTHRDHRLLGLPFSIRRDVIRFDAVRIAAIITVSLNS